MLGLSHTSAEILLILEILIILLKLPSVPYFRAHFITM